MKRAAILLALVMALAAVPAGCGKTEAVYDRDDKSISVKIGETFTIKLEANPTTGYEWNASVSDIAVVSLKDSEYLPDERVSGAVGAGGTQVLRFKANRAGTAAIDLTYRRSWEPRDDDERLRYTVTVE